MIHSDAHYANKMYDMLKIEKNIFDEWELLLKVLSDELPEKDKEFQYWLQEDIENRKLYRSLKEGKSIPELFDKDLVFNNISDELNFQNRKTPLYNMKWFKFAVAGIAAIALFLISDYFTLQRSMDAEKTEKNIFDPGSKKAFLFSKEGERTDLSSPFEMKKRDGTIISNTNQGVVKFTKTTPKKKRVEEQTIYVPKSGEYKLILSDGSNVYLNSESQLTFPSYFDDEIRHVTLSGEAFFEITTDKNPFVIETPNLKIEVLGTSLNVNAYSTNPYINTTLVEGCVQIHLPDNNGLFLLEPEQNFKWDKLSNEFYVQQVNTMVYTAWVHGEFVFRNQPLTEIFSQLERWYDFNIVYESPEIGAMRFTGSAEKKMPLNYLLDHIQSVTDLLYRTEGEKIILYKKSETAS